MILFQTLLAGALTLGLSASASAAVDPEDVPKGDDKVSPYVLGHAAESIDGSPVNLVDYEGRVVMIVNVASRCGLTPQYKELQALFETYRDEGFTILAFPANDFGNQEPGTNKQIAEFCEGSFGVEFPLFAKIAVKGEEKHPLYEQLAAQPDPLGGEPRWNFTKFLVNRRGEVVARFEPRTTPQDPKLVDKVRELLADKTLREGVQPWTPPERAGAE